MLFGEIELVKKKNCIRLLKVGARYGVIKYCILGGGVTKYFNDYDDALEEFNFRWLKEQDI